MNYSPYIGHPSQLCSVEEVKLQGGKGEGMRLLQIRTPAGLELTISVDRCADISRVIFKGINMGYFSPCGYVAPQYYDSVGDGFLKSFTAGFLTTCGLTAVGSPCVDDGESLPLHGTIANTPCERFYRTEDDDNLYIHAFIQDCRIFSHKLVMERIITISKTACEFSVRDTIINRGDATSPLLILYHMNMGYPLLSENSELSIPSVSVVPRNEHAAEGMPSWNRMLKPTPGFEEQCYFHRFADVGCSEIYNPDINKGLKIVFDTKELDCLTEWKMMGVHDYVLGLEPGNCTPDGRAYLREHNMLKYIQPGEERQFEVHIALFEK